MLTRTVLLIAAIAALADTAALRPARTADLAGTWQMVSITKAEDTDESDSFFAPYQLFRFDAGGRMKFMTATKPFTSLALFDSAPMVTRYSVDRRGILTLVNDAWDAPRKYLCRMVTKAETAADRKEPREGDLLLTGADDAGKAGWSKLLRKIE